jgi:membrane protein DedA with SNARE-associated domain
MCIVSFFGVLAGDIIVYSLGRYFGVQIFNRKIGKRLLNSSWYDNILKSFQKNGKMVLFAARFMPGLRAPIFLTAGITKFTGYGTFILIDGFAALISVPVWTYLGFYGASNMDVLLKWMKNTKIGIVIVLAVIIAVYFIGKLFKKKIVKAEIIMKNGDE